MRGVPDLGMRPVAVAPLMLLLFSLPVDIASAQVPAPVAPPYTLMDAESRTYIDPDAPHFERRASSNG